MKKRASPKLPPGFPTRCPPGKASLRGTRIQRRVCRPTASGKPSCRRVAHRATLCATPSTARPKAVQVWITPAGQPPLVPARDVSRAIQTATQFRRAHLRDCGVVESDVLDGRRVSASRFEACPDAEVLAERLAIQEADLIEPSRLRGGVRPNPHRSGARRHVAVVARDGRVYCASCRPKAPDPAVEHAQPPGHGWAQAVYADGRGEWSGLARAGIEPGERCASCLQALSNESVRPNPGRGAAPRPRAPGTPFPCHDRRIGRKVTGDRFAGTVIACATAPRGSRTTGLHFVVGGEAVPRSRVAAAARRARRRR